MENNIFYRIIDPKNHSISFDIHFKYFENAQKLCDFFSKRDNYQYEVSKRYMEIGAPFYEDDFWIEQLNNL